MTDYENYLRMGKEHVSKDKVISRKEVQEREKILNGNSRMWGKMFGIGVDAGHEARVMDSIVTHSNNLAAMSLLYKDHKLKEATRPVVSGNTSNSSALSNLVSGLIEAVANSISNPHEVISTEDMLARIVECNKEMARIVKEREENGEKLTPEEKEIILLGTDVIALFPNLMSANTGKIVSRLR